MKTKDEERKRALWVKGVARELRRRVPTLDALEASEEAHALVAYAYRARDIEGRTVTSVVASVLRHKYPVEA